MDDASRGRVEQAGADDLGDWRVVGGHAHAWFGAPTHAAGAALVGRLAALADAGTPLPDLDVRADGVQVRLVGPSGADTSGDLARTVSEAAAELGLVPDPSVLQQVRLVIDASERAALQPFWQDVLAYGPTEDGLADPLRRDPTIRFERQEPLRPLRNRLHVDVSRPQALIMASVDAVEGHGGRRNRSSEYHANLADADGNEVDVVPVGPFDVLDGGEETEDWRALFGAMAFYPVESPAVAAQLVSAVAGLADGSGFPLLVDVRPEGVTLDSGKDRWEEDDRFAALAVAVQAAARGLGLTADTSRLRFVQIGVDAVDVPAVREFWRAVLGYEHDPREHLTDVTDPRRLELPLFFQPMEPDDEDRRRQRDRMHLELHVPRDQVAARIATAEASGGRLLNDDGSAGRWTLADPEGNELGLVAPEVDG